MFSLITSVSPSHHSTDCRTSSTSIIQGWHNKPVVADVPNGLSLTSPQETKEKLLPKKLPGQNEEEVEDLQTGLLVSGPRF
jgi:hypothetical protein